MSDYQRELEFDRGIGTYWDTDMDVDDPGFKSKNIGFLENWGPALSAGQGFLDQYLGKSSKYQDKAESSFDTQQKAEDVARGTAAGWGAHELGSNFTALTPPVSGGQDQPFVIGGATGPQQPGTGQRMAGAAMGALSGAKTGSMIMPGVGTAIGAAIGGLGGWFCDERLKTDIAPLEKVDVHDELAEVAFLVKEIRECA
tara:strand:- start:638 stop:1234 length:597 start_codon:yes stop_codon:yes gene_type:complete